MPGSERRLHAQSGRLLRAGDLSNASFAGIDSAHVLSPTTVRLTWTVAMGCTLYEVYASDSAVPKGSTKFSSFAIVGLSPDTSYQFAVGGKMPDGHIDGLARAITVRTWPQFSGVQRVNAPSATTLEAAWSFPENGPTFSVYVSPGSLPYQFFAPAATTTGRSATITRLADGTPIQHNTTYYVIVRAKYLDGTAEQNNMVGRARTP